MRIIKKFIRPNVSRALVECRKISYTRFNAGRISAAKRNMTGREEQIYSRNWRKGL